MSLLKIVELEGLQDYVPILHMQHRLVAARHAGSLESDVALILEHTPVFTIGRNAGREHLKVSEDFLREKEIQVVRVKRGGDITYHGPGQVVAYPILDLRASRLSVPDYVRLLEETMIRTAADFGVKARRDSRNPGIWVGDRKLGSIGIAVRHGITYHGLALNATLSLEPFTWITPCGLTGVAMTSLKAEGARGIDMSAVRKSLSDHLGALLHMEPKGDILPMPHEEIANQS